MTVQETEILAFINKSISTENGQSVTAESTFLDAQLDSLGTLIAMMNIGSNYNIEEEEIQAIDYSTLTIKDLIELCKS